MIYEEFFSNVAKLKEKEDRLVLVTFFVARLRKQPAHIELVTGRGECNLILTIFQKYNIPHQVTVLHSGAAIFEKL